MERLSANAKPAPVATGHYVVFRLNDKEYGVKIDHVREVLLLPPVTAIPHTTSFIEGVVSIRGHLVAVVDARKRLGLKADAPTQEMRIMVAVVNRMVVGLLVDAVLDVLAIEESRIEPIPSVVQSHMAYHYVTGVGRVADRLIALIDLNSLLSDDEAAALERLR